MEKQISKAEAARILRGPQYTVWHHCRRCGAKFLTNVSGLWCSRACAQAAYRARKAAAAQQA
jgi:hypothetical protein